MTEERVAALEVGMDRTGRDVCEVKEKVERLACDVSSIKTDVEIIKTSLAEWNKMRFWLMTAIGGLLLTAMFTAIVKML